MTTGYQPYVAVLPDGREHAEELPFKTSHTEEYALFAAFAERAVRRYDLKFRSGGDDSVIVNIYRVCVSNGRLERVSVSRISTTLPRERMTETEYLEALTDILKKVPPAFRGFVSAYAWDHGHSNGYEEVILLADNLADDLLPAIKDYQKQLKKA